MREDGSPLFISCDAAPKADNIPWLLVEAPSHEGKEGMFSKVSYILRVDTVGGVVPVYPPSEQGSDAEVKNANGVSNSVLPAETTAHEQTRVTTLSQPIHIVCPHCQAINRVPPARLTEQPKCGKCHQALFTAHPIDLTTSTFELQATRNDIPLVVDFWAVISWPATTYRRYWSVGRQAAGLSSFDPIWRCYPARTSSAWKC